MSRFQLTCLFSIHCILLFAQEYNIDLNDEWLIYKSGKYLLFNEFEKTTAKHLFVATKGKQQRYLLLISPVRGTSVFVENVLYKRMGSDTVLIFRIDTISKPNILISVLNPESVSEIRAYLTSSPVYIGAAKSKSERKLIEIQYLNQDKGNIPVFLLYFGLIVINLFFSPVAGVRKILEYLTGLTNKPSFKNYDFFYLQFFVLLLAFNVELMNRLTELKINKLAESAFWTSVFYIYLFFNIYYLLVVNMPYLIRRGQFSSIHLLESVKTLHIMLLCDAFVLFFIILRPDLANWVDSYVFVFQTIVFLLLKSILFFRLNLSLETEKSIKIIYLCTTELVPTVLFISFFIRA